MAEICLYGDCDKPAEPFSQFCKDHFKEQEKKVVLKMQNYTKKSEGQETDKSGETQKSPGNN